MNKHELAQKIADLTDHSEAEIKHLLSQMDADQIINITVAVQDEDTDSIESIFDQIEDTSDELEDLSVSEIKARIKSLGNKLLKDDQELTEVWPLIGKLNAADWKMVWPTLDKQLLTALYQEATDEQKNDISAQDAAQIHDYSISYLEESTVLYENELWQVKIPQGPDNLVGITQQDHMIWVNRKELQPLHEHVLGMTQMPSINRMQQLAGIHVLPDAPVVTATNTVKKDSEDWLTELRMHMKEIEKLHESPQSPDNQEEIKLHMRALSRKAKHKADSWK